MEVSGAESEPISPRTGPPAASSSSGRASSIIAFASSSAWWSSGSVTRCSPCAVGGTSSVKEHGPREARSRTASIKEGVAAVLWATTRTRVGSGMRNLLRKGVAILPRVAQPLRLGQLTRRFAARPAGLAGVPEPLRLGQLTRRFAARPAGLAGVPEPLRLGQRLELLERVVLDLADPLARHVERPADLLQRPRALAGQAEAHLDDLALALRQRGKGTAHVVAAQVLGGQLEGRLGGVVLDEVAQLGLLLVADRLLQRHGLLRHAQDVAHLARRALELACDLLGRGLAAELLHELTLDVHDLVELLDHVH